MDVETCPGSDLGTHDGKLAASSCQCGVSDKSSRLPMKPTRIQHRPLLHDARGRKKPRPENLIMSTVQRARDSGKLSSNKAFSCAIRASLARPWPPNLVTKGSVDQVTAQHRGCDVCYVHLSVNDRERWRCQRGRAGWDDSNRRYWVRCARLHAPDDAHLIRLDAL